MWTKFVFVECSSEIRMALFKISSVKYYVQYMQLYENDYKMCLELQIYFDVYPLVS
jgi:hypothetical protein